MSSDQDVTGLVETVRKALKAATPGPWRFVVRGVADGEGFDSCIGTAGSLKNHQIRANPPGGTYPANDGRLIAGAPEWLSALCDAVTYYREREESLPMDVSELRHDLKHAKEDVERLTRDYQQAEAEAARLRAALDIVREHGVLTYSLGDLGNEFHGAHLKDAEEVRQWQAQLVPKVEDPVNEDRWRGTLMLEVPWAEAKPLVEASLRGDEGRTEPQEQTVDERPAVRIAALSCGCEYVLDTSARPPSRCILHPGSVLVAVRYANEVRGDEGRPKPPVTDHPYKPSPDGRCDQIVRGSTWTAFDPERCRRPESEHMKAEGTTAGERDV